MNHNNNSTTRFLLPHIALGRLSVSAMLAITVLSGCGGSSSDGGVKQPPTASAPYSEILDQGADQYLGSYSPMSSNEADGVVTHEFGGGDGPLCLDGSNYRMATRDQGSDELLIFLEGGGGCWSDFCAATTSAASGMPTAGLLDPTLVDNPTRDWSAAYLPYCDGSLFMGDADNDYQNDDVPEYQRGLKNLSAALDVISGQFSAPSRIVLAGNSGGGYGTIFALPLLRSLYPDTPIEIINDSGLGIGVPDDPTFIQGLIDDWNAGVFFPASVCPDCYANGHLSEYLNWQLAEDDNVQLAMISSKQDFVIGTVFAQIGGEAFEAALLPEMEYLEASNPDRFRSFVVDGNGHTFLQRDFAITANGYVLHDWISDMLESPADWISRQDP